MSSYGTKKQRTGNCKTYNISQKYLAGFLMIDD